jgi:tetratricopeptide (TPR) repeat protein
MRSRFQSLIFAFACLSLFSAEALAQRGIRGQIFLPNGAPVQKVTRFTLTTDNGLRTEFHYTDSNGRIQMPSVTGPYTITVESDGETYATTLSQFDTQYAGNYITIHLKPLRKANQPAPAVINAGDVDRDVSQKARERYDSALALIKEEKYDEAIEPLKQAIAIEKKYFHAHNDLGVVYMKLGQAELSEAMFKEAIRINDQMELPHLNLAILLNRQGRYKEVADDLLKYQRRFPSVNSIHGPLIEALIESRMWAEAEAELKRALDLKMFDEVDLKTKLGAMQIRQGKFEAAAATLQEAVAKEPDNAAALFNLGTALLQAGKLDEAEKRLLRAYEIRGSSMPGAQLMLGQLYFQKKDYEKALGAFENYLRDLPDAPNAPQVKEAVRQLREATGKKP